MLQGLPHKGIVYLIQLINAYLRLDYVPASWEIAKMIAIPKPSKPAEAPESYQPISLLSLPFSLRESNSKMPTSDNC